MSAEAPAGLAAIGGTPVVRLGRLVTPAMAEVWVKLEGGNPTGSYKDRMAVAMIEGAERAGRLRSGQTVVEYTGGSTGASLAFVCALKGYPLRIVTAAAVAPEKIAVMRAFGAQVEILLDSDRLTADLMPRLMARAREIVDETGAYATDQFRNPDMVAGYRALGQELARQLEGRLDALCLSVGTGGCLLGTSRALRESIPEVAGSPSNQPNRPFCQEDSLPPMASKASASASGRPCFDRTTSTRCSRFRPRRPSR